MIAMPMTLAPGAVGIASPLLPPRETVPSDSSSAATKLSRVLFRARRTNHPHDRAATELLALVAHERDFGFEVFDEASGLVSRHGRWDRADTIAGGTTGRPDQLPADFVVEVEEVTSMSSREIYDVVLSECRLELTANVRMARDGSLASRWSSTVIAVENGESAALEAARRTAIAEMGEPLLRSMRKTLEDLKSGRLDVVVECVEGDLRSFLEDVSGVSAEIQIAEDGINGADVVKVSVSEWRMMADRGLVIHDVRPGWVLVSADSSASSPRGMRWRILAATLAAVLMLPVMTILARRLVAYIRSSR